MHFGKRLSAILVSYCILTCPMVAEGQNNTRAKLQIMNGSQQAVDMFWLDGDARRVPNGSLEPNEQTTIRTTLGHKFAVVGREDNFEATVTCEVPIQGFRYAPPSATGVPAFYTQSADATGFPIVASDSVNPYALKEAAYLIDQMLSNRPDVRQALIKSGARMCLIAHNEFTTDLPEFSRLGNSPAPGMPQINGKDFWDARARGTGGSESDPFCSTGEENLLAYKGDPYYQESILIHEFAHCIHLRGMTNVDPSFDRRLRKAYDNAMKSGLWKGKYASVNHHEYFAEGVQSWFDNNRSNDHDHNHVDTRAELVEYDPALAAICGEVFGETEIKYTKPTTRLTGHLAGYDPTTAPTFNWPKRLQNARRAIQESARNRGKEASPYENREILGWQVKINRELLKPSAKETTEKALQLLEVQLAEIADVLPNGPLNELRKVTFWFSPEYPNTAPGAEYHPNPKWLAENNRNPEMAKGVEFTNSSVFEAETRRMPNFALHELAHAYHNRVLPDGFGNSQIKAAYEKAKASGLYDQVERQDSEGRKRMDRAYALTNPQEYFAESTESYFSKNDFFPYDRNELQRHDPEVCRVLEKLWQLDSQN